MKRKYIIWLLFLLVFFIFLIASFNDVFEVVVKNHSRYQWFVVGGILMVILCLVFRGNRDIIITSHHEVAHFVASLFTGKEIYQMKIGKQEGSVVSGGNKFMVEMVALAPYCLPIYAYVIMLFGSAWARDMLWLYSLLLGMCYTCHLISIKKDFQSLKIMGRHQDDINRYPLIFSYTYILCFWLFNTYIVLISVRSDVFKAFKFMFDCLVDLF